MTATPLALHFLLHTKSERSVWGCSPPGPRVCSLVTQRVLFCWDDSYTSPQSCLLHHRCCWMIADMALPAAGVTVSRHLASVVLSCRALDLLDPCTSLEAPHCVTPSLSVILGSLCCRLSFMKLRALSCTLHPQGLIVDGISKQGRSNGARGLPLTSLWGNRL